MEHKSLRSTAGVIIVVLFAMFATHIYLLQNQIQTETTSKLLEGDDIYVDANNIDNLFIYISADEARELLSEAGEAGKFKYIFPQIDLDNIESFTIENYEIKNEDGSRVILLGIRGLPPGTKIYSNIDGTIRASSINYDDEDSQSLVIFTGKSEDFTSEFYLPYIAGPNDLAPELTGALDVTIGVPFTNIPDGGELEKEIFKEGWQMAIIINSLRTNELTNIIGGEIENILTKNGKIVMIR